MQELNSAINKYNNYVPLSIEPITIKSRSQKGSTALLL